MKNIVLIMLLCFALLGCKSRKSHVQKSSLDSLVENREVKNLEMQALLTRSQNTTLVQDSNWLSAVNLINFSGTIFRDGTIEGNAESASVNQSGSKNSELNNQTSERDSTTVKEAGEKESKAQVKKKEVDRGKQVKGKAAPWWMWLLAIMALLLSARWINSKLKPL